MLLDRPDPIVDDATRRQLLIGGLSAAALLTACGSDDDTPAPSGSGEGWSFTDDRGTTVSLPSRPTRIAAYEIAGGTLLFLGAPVRAVFGGTALDQSAHLDGLDLTGVESAGAVYGEVDYEMLAALDVDLIVTLFDGDAVFGLNDAAAQSKAEQIAPLVAFNGTADVQPNLARFAGLAEALGADLQAPAVSTARARYTQARESLRAATAAKPGLTAVALYADPGAGTLSFSGPDKYYPQLREFVELGLALVPDTTEQVSLEEADKYLGDLVLVDTFNDLAANAEVPTWSALPAIAAGQTVSYEPLVLYRYDKRADELEAVAAAVRAADPDLVP